MKRVFAVLMLLAFAVGANAGVYRASKKVIKPAYKHALKPAAKVASYPLRHPKKSGKKVAHGAKKVLD